MKKSVFAGFAVGMCLSVGALMALTALIAVLR